VQQFDFKINLHLCCNTFYTP